MFLPKGVVSCKVFREVMFAVRYMLSIFEYQLVKSSRR